MIDGAGGYVAYNFLNVDLPKKELDAFFLEVRREQKGDDVLAVAHASWAQHHLNSSLDHMKSGQPVEIPGLHVDIGYGRGQDKDTI